MPGKLILIVGNSGSGKDSLLRVLKNHSGPNFHLAFPRRWITRRQGDPNESYHPATLAEFARKVKNDEFYVWWEAYDYLYGYEREVADLLSSGFNTVINVSRGVVQELKQRYLHTTVVFVAVPMEMIHQRLYERDRGELSELKCRLERAESYRDFNHWDYCFHNVDDLQHGGPHFVTLIENIISSQ